MARLPLTGVTVLELAGLAPAPFCGKILRDFGAEVVIVAKGNSEFIDVFSSGKKSILLDLKKPTHRDVFLHMTTRSDVLIDPYRPGVLEKLGLSPSSLHSLNSRLIIARLSGWGRSGPLSTSAGHDLNYLALTGVLGTLAHSSEETPFPPHNLLADMAGGGVMCALGILLAMVERAKSGKGQVVDAAMLDGVVYLSSFLFHMKSFGLWNEPIGKNLLDTGAFFYNIYKCKDGKFIAVACLEKRFYQAFTSALSPHLSPTDLSTLQSLSQYDPSHWETGKRLLTHIFQMKSRDCWTDIFSHTDCCVSPILSPLEAANHPHNISRGLFQKDESQGGSFPFVPEAAPRLSRTPGSVSKLELVSVGKDSIAVLEQFEVPKALINAYRTEDPTAKL